MKNRVIKLLVSSRTALGLMSAILVYILAVVYLSPLTGDGQSWFGGWWFAAALVGLGLSIVLCTLRRAVRLYRASSEESQQKNPQGPPAVNEILTGLNPGEIEDRLRRKGFRLYSGGEWVYGVKHPYSSWGSVLFHLGLVAILAGFGISAMFGMRGEVMIPEGVAVRFPGELNIIAQGPFYSDTGPYLAGLREFTVSKVNGEINQVRGILDFMAGDFRYQYQTEINNPARYSGYYWRIKDYGYSAHLVIRDKSGNTVIADYANIGKANGRHHDEFLLPDGSGFTIDFLEPASADGSGNNNPGAGKGRAAIRISFTKAGETGVPAQGTVAEAAAANIGDYQVGFPDYRYWGIFDVSRDPGEPLVYLGGLMGIGGLAWRAFFIRKRIWIRFAVENGATLVSWTARADYFSSLFGNEVRELLDDERGKV